MKIIVTGGNGFIGSHLTEYLISLGHDVSALDIKFDSNTKDLECEKIQADISKDVSILEKLKNSDCVIHLAAISRVDDCQDNPTRCFEVNVKGVLNIIEAIKNSDVKLIFSSSREVYGEPEKVPVKEPDTKNPLTVYGASKLSGEQLIRTYKKLYGLNYITLRLANVFGSTRDLPQRVIPRFIESATKNSPLTINGGNQVIDFTFVDDVIEGIANVIKKIDSDEVEIFGEDFNLASGKGTSVKNLAMIIKELFNSNSKLTFLEERNYDVKNFIGDCSKAKSALLFEPKHSLLEGLKIYKERFH